MRRAVSREKGGEENGVGKEWFVSQGHFSFSVPPTYSLVTYKNPFHYTLPSPTPPPPGSSSSPCKWFESVSFHNQENPLCTISTHLSTTESSTPFSHYYTPLSPTLYSFLLSPTKYNMGKRMKNGSGGVVMGKAEKYYQECKGRVHRLIRAVVLFLHYAQYNQLEEHLARALCPSSTFPPPSFPIPTHSHQKLCPR